MKEIKDIFLFILFFSFFFGLLPFVLFEGHNTLESYQEFTNERTEITQKEHPEQP